MLGWCLLLLKALWLNRHEDEYDKAEEKRRQEIQAKYEKKKLDRYNASIPVGSPYEASLNKDFRTEATITKISGKDCLWIGGELFTDIRGLDEVFPKGTKLEIGATRDYKSGPSYKDPDKTYEITFEDGTKATAKEEGETHAGESKPYIRVFYWKKI